MADAQTLVNLWKRAVDRFSSRPLIISDKDDSVFSYEAAEQVASRTTSRLQAMGLTKGDKICIHSRFHLEALFVFLASSRLGIVLSPLDYHTSSVQAGNIVSRLKPKLIFVDKDRLAGSGVFGSIPLVVFDEAEDGPNQFHAPNFSTWLTSAEAPANYSPVEITADDAALILFTSGTTGEPKGVVLSHGGLVRCGVMVTEKWRWAADDVLLCLAELHSVASFRNTCVATPLAGCALVEAGPSARSSVFAIADCIERRKCTMLMTAPALIRQLVDQSSRTDPQKLSSLRFAISDGSPLSAQKISQFQTIYGTTLYVGYGLTEATGRCIGEFPGLAHLNTGSIGVPLDCRIRIVDDHGQPLGNGETGELLVAGDRLMKGYYANDALTREVLNNGWLYTGDLAMTRPDDHVVIIGRKKDIIKNAAGDAIHPGEVEEVLESHPLVRDVGVCGFLSPFGDERLAAFVIPLEDCRDEEALYESLRARVVEQLGVHKVPAIFKVLRELPRNTNGKVMRRKLRELL